MNYHGNPYKRQDTLLTAGESGYGSCSPHEWKLLLPIRRGWPAAWAVLRYNGKGRYKQGPPGYLNPPPMKAVQTPHCILGSCPSRNYFLQSSTHIFMQEIYDLAVSWLTGVNFLHPTDLKDQRWQPSAVHDLRAGKEAYIKLHCTEMLILVPET